MNRARRSIIVHHHIFKNAGASFDHLLQRSFGARWATFEGSHAGDIIGADKLEAFLLGHPELLAVSSHQARFMPAPHPILDIYPIVFIRDPIDRAESVYLFESRQGASHASARIAATSAFSEYVRWSLRDDDEAPCVIRNYQTIHLSDALRRVREAPLARATAGDLLLAKQRIAALPAFGLVDRFNDSLRLFQRWLGLVFPELTLSPVAVNTSPGRKASFEDRIANIKSALGDDLFARLHDYNAFDLDLCGFATELFAERLAEMNSSEQGEKTPQPTAAGM